MRSSLPSSLRSSPESKVFQGLRCCCVCVSLGESWLCFCRLGLSLSAKDDGTPAAQTPRCMCERLKYDLKLSMRAESEWGRMGRGTSLQCTPTCVDRSPAAAAARERVKHELLMCPVVVGSVHVGSVSVMCKSRKRVREQNTCPRFKVASCRTECEPPTRPLEPVADV